MSVSAEMSISQSIELERICERIFERQNIFCDSCSRNTFGFSATLANNRMMKGGFYKKAALKACGEGNLRHT